MASDNVTSETSNGVKYKMETLRPKAKKHLGPKTVVAILLQAALLLIGGYGMMLGFEVLHENAGAVPAIGYVDCVMLTISLYIVRVGVSK